MFSSISGSSFRMVLGKSFIIINTETNWLYLIKKKKSIRFLKLISEKMMLSVSLIGSYNRLQGIWSLKDASSV